MLLEGSVGSAVQIPRQRSLLLIASLKAEKFPEVTCNPKSCLVKVKAAVLPELRDTCSTAAERALCSVHS